MFLRANTTLDRTPQQISDLGKKTVEENIAAIAKIGVKKFHSTDLQTIVADLKNKPEEHFQSKEELLALSTRSLERAKNVTAAKLVDAMPQQDVVIRPLSAFEEDAGVGSRFQQEPNL